jgi:hypothetical protein
MVIIASTLVDILVTAPLIFLAGLLVGLIWGSKYEIIVPRRREEEEK